MIEVDFVVSMERLKSENLGRILRKFITRFICGSINKLLIHVISNTYEIVENG